MLAFRKWINVSKITEKQRGFSTGLSLTVFREGSIIKNDVKDLGGGRRKSPSPEGERAGLCVSSALKKRKMTFRPGT